jgi:putative sugar O-methyltransferase
MTTQSSNLWRQIVTSLFSDVDEEFLESFRSPGGANSRLAVWDPYDKSMRYYKFLLYNTARAKTAEFFDLYGRLENVGLGRPVSVRIAQCDINVDYLLAVEEYQFIQRNLELSRVQTVVEIGAGFGRTCHAILTLAPAIETYTIIDPPEVLALSRTYLQRAAPALFDKIEFLDCNEPSLFQGRTADLGINIDSFQEMLPDVIDSYMAKVIANCGAFYCKNPTGKYAPHVVGLPELSPEQIQDVYSLGYCREVFDLFDDEALAAAARKYLVAYLPCGVQGANDSRDWKTVAEEPMEMFRYLHHALYKAF